MCWIVPFTIILAYLLGGERATWPKLGMIANRRALELGINEAIRQLTKSANGC